VVGVREGSEQRTLHPLYGPPTEGPPFEWGYRGRGATELAQAILHDRLSFAPTEAVALAFMIDVIAKLPKEEFELPASSVDAWTAERLEEACVKRME
jgi:hypothetical protein